MVDIDYIIEISNIIQKSLGADETFSSIFNILEKTIPFDSATLFVYNQDINRLEVVLKRGQEIIDLAQEIPFAHGSGMSSWVLDKKQPIVLSSITKSRPGKDRIFNSFLSMPLRVGDKLIGVLNLGHMKPNMYKVDQKKDYVTIATQISLVMEKIFLRSSLEQRNQTLQSTLDELKKAQEQLVEKERLAAIGEIVVTVNHEINNPLSAIIGLAEILELMVESGDKDKIRESVKAILKGANRIKKVTVRLTQISSSESEEYIEGIRMIKLPDDNRIIM